MPGYAEWMSVRRHTIGDYVVGEYSHRRPEQGLLLLIGMPRSGRPLRPIRRISLYSNPTCVEFAAYQRRISVMELSRIWPRSCHSIRPCCRAECRARSIVYNPSGKKPTRQLRLKVALQ